MPTSAENIRPCRFAGSFYPGNADELRQHIETLLDEAPDYAADGRIVAAAVPHAGYVYSAPIAAPVFKALAHADFDTAVIIGHDFGQMAPGIIGILPTFTAYRTPLGDIPVDSSLCQALHQADSRIVFNDRVHLQEHTIEVQLPFLQLTHPNLRIVPILFGDVTPEHCRRLAELLQALGGNRRILLLSSTDLSHYPDDATGRELDVRTLAFAQSLDLAGLCSWRDGGEWQERANVVTPICSAGGLGCAIAWSKLQGNGAPPRVVSMQQGNSGDVSGDTSRCVGYASLLFVAENAKEDCFTLPETLMVQLLQLARQSIANALAGKAAPKLQIADCARELQRPSAVFVTLHTIAGHRLRGCIGTTVATMPLGEAVIHFAQAAAFEDPRFPAVTADELPKLRIELSVLSPLRQIPDASAIVPGRHGVVVRRNGRSGLFLPQVWEQLPQMEEFMGYLCAQKAGLPHDAWRDPGTQLFTFTVLSCEEEK